MKHLLYFMTFTLLLLANAFSLFAVESVWDGKTIATSFYSGSGTKSNPYTIYTASQFAYFYKEMTNGRTFEGEYISLKNDIDMANTYLDQMDGVQNSSFSFYGYFDGEDHSLAAKSYGYYAYIFDDIYGSVGNIVFSKYQTKIADVCSGGELYNCKLEKTKMGAIHTDEGGIVANCYCNDNEHWQNNSKYGGANGLCYGNGSCLNCQFTGMTYISYGGSTASNYGCSNSENNGVTDDEHNEWVSANSTSEKTYKTWPLTFNPTYPSYTVNVSFIDESGFTNYADVQRIARSSYSLPVPSGFESEFLGWDVNGEIVTSFIPTDKTVCTAKWKHSFVNQPSLLSPTAIPLDKAKATAQWYRKVANDETLSNTVTTFNIKYDNTTLELDYSVTSSSGGYSSDGYDGDLSIDGTVIVSCSNGKKVSDHYTTTLSKGTHTISRSAATTTNITLCYPSTPVGDENTYQLDLSNLSFGSS